MLDTAGGTGGAYFAGPNDPIIKQIQGAADFIGTGAIEINMYEAEILDLVRRESILRQRVDERPATGHPHRYFEQTAIGTGQFSDPRTLAPTNTGPTRVERPAMIKALVNQVNLTLFDVQVTQQQGVFTGLEAKDIEDCVNGIIIAAAPAYWSGTDTSLAAPTTLQYVGLLTQITYQFTIAPGASIIDGIKYAVAQMMSNQTFRVRPTGIYLNPTLGHYIDTEAKNTQIVLGTTVIGGVTVKEINTQAGNLPLIPDVWMPSDTTAKYGFAAPQAGLKNYYCVVTTEKMIERPYIDGGRGNPNPQLFRLGLQNSLTGQYVSVMFDCIIAKGRSYAHSLISVQRV